MSELWSQDKLAERWGVSVRTLERHRVAGTGVQYVQIGRLIRYRLADILAYEASQLRASTSQAA